MKGKILFVVFVMVLFCTLTGCGVDSIFEKETEAFHRKAHAVATEVQSYRNVVNDEELWKSMNLMADMLQKTIEPGKKIEVFIRIDGADEDINLLDSMYQNGSLGHISSERRRMQADEIILGILKDDRVSEACQSGKTIKVTGLILRWHETDLLGRKHYYSVCDSNLDGIWDYVANGDIHFIDRSLYDFEDGVDIESIKARATVASIEASPMALSSLVKELN